MHVLAFTWPWAVAFWLAFIWAFSPEFGIVRRAQRSVKVNKAKDRGSLQVILLGMNVAMFASFPLATVRSLSFPPSWIVPSFVAGIVLLLAGSAIRRHCWRVLGEFFTGDVQARADQPVIDRGAYRWVRHPSYSGGILMLTGIGIALANWGSVVVLVIAAVAVYSYRVFAEERALVETIGEPYREYIARTKRFVPFVV